MTTRSKRWAQDDHWLARLSFGLVVAGIAAWLVTLYWTGPFDFWSFCCTGKRQRPQPGRQIIACRGASDAAAL